MGQGGTVVLEQFLLKTGEAVLVMEGSAAGKDKEVK